TVQLSGRVIGVDGKPATSAYLYLEESPVPDYGSTQDAQTDAKGEFALRGVAPGSYVLHARERMSEDDASYRATRKIEVGDQNLDSITLVLGRGVKFEGRIDPSGSGTLTFRHLYISLNSPQGEDDGGYARVKKDGTFQLLDVPDGTFSFAMFGLEEGWYIKSVRAGADDVLANGL